MMLDLMNFQGSISLLTTIDLHTFYISLNITIETLMDTSLKEFLQSNIEVAFLVSALQMYIIFASIVATYIISKGIYCHI